MKGTWISEVLKEELEASGYEILPNVYSDDDIYTHTIIGGRMYISGNIVGSKSKFFRSIMLGYPTPEEIKSYGCGFLPKLKKTRDINSIYSSKKTEVFTCCNEFESSFLEAYDCEFWYIENREGFIIARVLVWDGMYHEDIYSNNMTDMAILKEYLKMGGIVSLPTQYILKPISKVDIDKNLPYMDSFVNFKEIDDNIHLSRLPFNINNNVKIVFKSVGYYGVSPEFNSGMFGGYNFGQGLGSRHGLHNTGNFEIKEKTDGTRYSTCKEHMLSYPPFVSIKLKDGLILEGYNFGYSHVLSIAIIHNGVIVCTANGHQDLTEEHKGLFTNINVLPPEWVVGLILDVMYRENEDGTYDMLFGDDDFELSSDYTTIREIMEK